jgi:hypothetical protein
MYSNTTTFPDEYIDEYIATNNKQIGLVRN